jgi:hypothetical protein
VSSNEVSPVAGIVYDTDPQINLAPAARAINGFAIGAAGTSLSQLTVYSPALTPASVPANSTAEQTFTVTGLATTDKVFINKPTHQAGLSIGNVRVSAANTLAIEYVNTSAGAITPTAETYQLIAIH